MNEPQTTEIVERLRLAHQFGSKSKAPAALFKQAADEIERLTAALASWEEAHKGALKMAGRALSNPFDQRTNYGIRP